MRADFTKLAAVATNEKIFIATYNSFGQTWAWTALDNSPAGVTTWRDITGSSDLVKMIATSGGDMYKTINSGTTWSQVRRSAFMYEYDECV